MDEPAREDLPALIQRALALRKAGRSADSFALFQSASATRPFHPGLRLEAAWDLRALGRYEEAKALYEATLATHAGHAGAMLGIGLCARDLGDTNAALPWLQRAREADPANLAAALEAAAELRRLERLDEADAAYADVLKRHPDHIAALLGRALCARRRGDGDVTRQLLEQAIATDPAHPGARLELAAELRDVGEFEAARAQVAALLVHSPDNAAALISLGLSERAAGRLHAALAAFTRAHEAHPSRADVLVQMAIEHRTLGQLDLWERRLDQAYALAPNDVAVLVQRAERARMADDLPGMHAIYEAASAAQPSALPLQLGLAEARVLLGQVEPALDQLTRLEDTAADRASVRLKRLNVLRRMGDIPAALSLSREACRDWPGHFNIWAERLMCEAVAGDATTLAACFDAAPARTAKDRARLARLRAHVHEDRGERDDAMAWLDRAEALDPGLAERAMVATRVALGQLDLVRAREGVAAFIQATQIAAKLRGRSSHPSQTLFGQLIDELALDAACISVLRAGRNQTGPARVEAVLQQVAQNPGSTAAALELVTALRNCGLAGSPLPWPPDSAYPAHIPRTVLQFWDNANPPDDVVMLMRSWGAINVDHAYRRFDTAAAHDFLVTTYGGRAGAVFARAKVAAQQADLFRLGYLSALGGTYADADDRCIAPLPTILPRHARLVLYLEDLGSIGNNFISAAPGHHVLVRAFDLAMSAIARGDEDTIWLSTGPGLLTRTLAETLARAGPDWRAVLADIVILSRRDVYRAVGIHCATGYKVTNAHWASPPARQRRSSRRNTAG